MRSWIALCLALQAPFALAEITEGDSCEAKLSPTHISNYVRKTTEQKENQRTFNLTITAGSSKYTLGIQELGDDLYRMQLVRPGFSDPQIEKAVVDLAGLIVGRNVENPFGSELYAQFLFKHADDRELVRQLEQAAKSLEMGLSTNTFIAQSVRNVSKSVTAQTLNKLLVDFIRREGLDEEDRFFATRLGFIHNELIFSLTARERAFFDYAIFDEVPGYKAEARAEEVLATWRKIEPTAESWSEIHDTIRAKLMVTALRHRAIFRGMEAYRLTVMDKARSALGSWLKLNPLDRLLHFHDVVEKNAVTLADARLLQGLSSRQEPRPGSIYQGWALFEDLNARLRKYEKNPSEENERMVKIVTQGILSAWVGGLSRNSLMRVARIVDQGMALEDIAFVLTLQKEMMLKIEDWDRAELRKLVSNEKPASNLNPFSIEHDQKGRVLRSSVRFQIARQSYSVGPGSRAVLNSLGAGFVDAAVTHIRPKNLYRDSRD